MTLNTTALHDLSVVELAAGLRGKQFSAVEAAQHFLARAKAHQNLGAYVALNEDATLAQAQAADARIAAGTAGALEGVPIAHKDIFVTQAFPSTAGSKMLAGYQSPFDATVVTKLAEAGAVTLGKLNCDEFAMGSANENSAVAPVGFDAPAPVRNPWATDRIPGGSSGGSAVAVAARLAPAVTGTDTGGSIRQPAAFTNLTGLKPTYGRVSRWGMIAYASSLDQGGPLARNAEDCALLLGAMAGYFGGWIDNIIMRIVDVFYCIPSMPVIIIIGAAMDAMRVDSWKRMMYLMLILGFLGWPSIARLVRGQILSLREQEFMLATEACGIKVWHRIFRHLIPNVIPQLIVTCTMGLGSTILTEATLSFLGLGVKYPFASWGNIINDVNNAYVMTNYLFIWIPAGVCLLLTVLGFNFVGDGLRDAFDPKMKR